MHPRYLIQVGELNAFSPRQIGFLGFKTINADVDATGSENMEREQTHRGEGVENQAETSQNVEIQAS